jgi:hypothetical protein
MIGTISGCWVNLKAKMYLYVNFTSQRCLNKIIKIIKTFMIEDFFHLLPMSTTRVLHLELRISPRIKIWNSPNGILRGWGETDSWKNQNSKISWHCPFKRFLPESILFLVDVSSLLASVSSPSLPIYADRISTQHEQRYYRLRSPRCKLWPLSKYYIKTCWIIFLFP